MKLGVYVVRDVKSTFMTPTFDVNDNTAIRNFAHAVQTSGTVISSHKQDFELYKVGEYDNETGFVEKLDVRELLCEGSDF